MAVKSLAVKYRPRAFEDVVEQDAVIDILCNQLDTGGVKNAYLFCGGAGTGKTTCARIFANEINDGVGNPIEMDAASNSSVEDVREIIQQAKTKSLDSEYKIFIIDECHSLSGAAWQALLKLIEEPPAKSIFIFCTTDPQKIPKTILSRVQRYTFQRISFGGIASRLWDILQKENVLHAEREAVEYIAKMADGGMRDAITMMDKCLAYKPSLTVESVVNALGTPDFDTMGKLYVALRDANAENIIHIIESVHREGKDLKLFMKSFTNFCLDVCKYMLFQNFDFLEVPGTPEMKKLFHDELSHASEYAQYDILKLAGEIERSIKWETSPKAVIEAGLLSVCYGG